MAGGPSTPALTAAVSEAGGLGFLALGYLSGEQAAEQIAEVAKLSARPFGVNLFSPGPGPTEPARYYDYVRRLSERGLPIGDPRYSDDDYDAKIELVLSERPAAASFTFGAPTAAVVDRLHHAGSEVWITITSPAEADEAVAAGADALVVQGSEAGGHRGSFVDREGLPLYSLLPLLQLVGAAHDVPLVATGGIATAAGVSAVIAAGASAAQIGTAFMLCPEAGTNPAHRDALRSDAETSLTRAFTGRLARGIRNGFMREHDAAAPIAYPEIHYVTAPFRKAARERGDASQFNLWAGEAHQLAVELPAAELVARLSA